MPSGSADRTDSESPRRGANRSVESSGYPVFSWCGSALVERLETERVITLAWAINGLSVDITDALAANKLTTDEQARADRFRFEPDRTAYVVARAGLRHILGEFLDIPPAAIPLCTNEQGKPFLSFKSAARRLEFNLSHSGGLAVAAFARGFAVGVDIEHIPQQNRLPTGVAERCFTPLELGALKTEDETERCHAFYRLWTRKEAVVKLLGDGLQTPLLDFEVDATKETAGWVKLPAGNRLGLDQCWLQSLPTEQGYLASLACERQPSSVDASQLT